MGPLMTMRGHEHPPPVAHLADSTMLLRKILRLQLTCSTVNTDCWSTFVLLKAFTNTLDKYPLQLASEIQEKKHSCPQLWLGEMPYQSSPKVCPFCICVRDKTLSE